MRVAIVAETFLPEFNGVTNSILRVVDHLSARGHEVLVIAPGLGPAEVGGVPVERVPGLSVPRYPSLAVGLPTRRLGRLLDDFAPDVVHAAAPVLLGAGGLRAARERRIPTVAIYQTDLAGFAGRYHLPALAAPVWRWLRTVHSLADLTLAPSSSAMWALRRHGIGPIRRWARGVDVERFSPHRRDQDLRRRWAPDDRLIVGYVGRLANEKGLDRLAPLAGRDDLQLVLVGDGPVRRHLEAALPGAQFTGFLDGPALARAVASFDVFVHTGLDETFCQAVQEALASGVPVVAPAAGGPLDLVRHAENGFLWSPDREATLVEAVDSLVGDRALLRGLAASARPSVVRRTWDRIGDELLGHYRSVMHPAPPVRGRHAA